MISPGFDTYHSGDRSRRPRSWEYAAVFGFLLLWLLPMAYQGMTRRPLYADLIFAVSGNREIYDRLNIRPPHAFRDGITAGDVVAEAHIFLAFHHRATCLFTRRKATWNDYHMQATTHPQLAETSWFTLPDERYSPMESFGHMARVDRLFRRLATEFRLAKRAHKENASAPEDKLAPGAFPIYPVTAARVGEIVQWYARRYRELNPDGERLTGLRLVRIKFPVGGPLANPQGRWYKRTPEQLAEIRGRPAELEVIFARRLYEGQEQKDR